MNPNIGKEASKGGRARMKLLTKGQRRELGMKAAYIRWARRAVAKEQKEETPA